jgi:hypothetical protein
MLPYYGFLLMYLPKALSCYNNLFCAKYNDSEQSMSYIINNSRGQVLAVVADGTVNTTATDLSLVGRALTDYGTFENENYVFLLENFANSTAPLQPILGQLWYNSSTDVLSAYGSGNAWIPLASQEYVQLQKVSPAFTGIPTAPTAPTGTSTTQLATTAFVTASPAFTGIPTAPTAAPGTNTTQLATTAYVSQSPQFVGVPTAPTAAPGTNTTQLATTEFVTSGPAFAIIPTAPTAVESANGNQLATTAFVQNQKISPALTGAPTAPTATVGDSSGRIATTAFVQGEKASPAFTGTPTAPTAVLGTSTTQIATTQFVQNATASLPTMSQQNADAVAITGGTITGITPLLIAFGGTSSNTPAGARINLGLGNIATQNSDEVTITGGTVDNAVITGGNISGLNTPLAIVSGGTGAVNAGNARINLGLGTVSTQNANNISITGGNISGLNTPLPVASGGTSGNDQISARAGLGLGSIATQNANAVGITGGTLVGVTQFNGANVTITSGSISGIVPLAVADGGTSGNTAASARNGIGAAFSGTQIIAGAGLSGGGSLANDRTLSIATNSNGFGVRYVSTEPPTSAVGNNGDIWYQI